MSDGLEPRDLAMASIKFPALPDGTDERLSGYGVMGLPFRSGHYLALRNYPATSIGEGFTAVWYRDRAAKWTFFANVPPDASCARYVGAASPDGARHVPIDVTWTGPRSFNVTIPEFLDWNIHLASTETTKLFSRAGRLLPDRIWWATESTALVCGRDIGPPGPLPEQDRLGDFSLPQRGIFAVGSVRFDTFDPARHRPAAKLMTPIEGCAS